MLHHKYFPSHPVQIGDNSADAFGRLRVSDPTIIFESTQILSPKPLIWDTSNAGDGYAQHDGYASLVKLIVGPNAGDQVIRQTFQSFNYNPGRSLMILLTGVLTDDNTDETCLTRYGYFDENNGIAFQLDGTTAGVVIRSNVTQTAVDTVITQDNWNRDTMDGQGPSQITLDFSKSQIFMMDVQWLGVGRVRFGFQVGGHLIICHEALNDNVRNTPYMRTPNLPIRMEIENLTGGGGRVAKQICAAVAAEGALKSLGIVRSVDRGTTVFSASSADVLYPVLSIRLAPGHQGVNVNINHLNVTSPSGAGFRWGLYFSPTIAGTDQASWQSVSDSGIQYDISRNTTNVMSDGALIVSGYISAAGGNSIPPSVLSNILNDLRLGFAIDGTPNEMVLGVESLTVTETFLASITYTENF